ncbi:helix-turn-helix domain-containing protein [Flavobacterium terrisoli]|uniref:helix-turn-helix domain-containing protein n=1 Tax=Flavobacterium terrisoli TaxID=3242195 RepID=UPI002543E0ED|nr:AraC family transcriptional regulator [Flavobacterium buctense]
MKADLHIPVSSPLKEYITAIWEVYGQRYLTETILPKGIFEMVFNLADDMDGILPFAHQLIRTPKCFIQGINTQVINANYHGQQHLFGIRLQPHMVQSLLGIMPSELNNIIVDLTLIKPEFNLIWEQLIEAQSFEERVRIIETLFPILEETDSIRTKKLSTLFLSNSIENFQSVDRLTEQVYYSSRHLNRKVHSIFGMSAEELVIYKKFLHSVNLMHGEKTTLTDIAYRSGFYDQSHFSRVFKNYSGITAKAYQNQKGELPFHLFS